MESEQLGACSATLEAREAIPVRWSEMTDLIREVNVARGTKIAKLTSASSQLQETTRTPVSIEWLEARTAIRLLERWRVSAI